MRKPLLEYDSRGESGNIFAILGELLRIMRHNNNSIPFSVTKQRYEAICQRVFKSKSYEDALRIIGEEVTLIDTAK